MKIRHRDADRPADSNSIVPRRYRNASIGQQDADGLCSFDTAEPGPKKSDDRLYRLESVGIERPLRLAAMLVAVGALYKPKPTHGCVESDEDLRRLPFVAGLRHGEMWVRIYVVP